MVAMGTIRGHNPAPAKYNYVYWDKFELSTHGHEFLKIWFNMMSSRPCCAIAPWAPASFNSVVKSYGLSNAIFPSSWFELQDHSKLYTGKRHS
jgi:hypothetical protein